MDGAENADSSSENFREREESPCQIVSTIIESSMYKTSHDSLRNTSRYS